MKYLPFVLWLVLWPLTTNLRDVLELIYRINANMPIMNEYAYLFQIIFDGIMYGFVAFLLYKKEKKED